MQLSHLELHPLLIHEKDMHIALHTYRLIPSLLIQLLPLVEVGGRGPFLGHPVKTQWAIAYLDQNRSNFHKMSKKFFFGQNSGIAPLKTLILLKRA